MVINPPLGVCVGGGGIAQSHPLSRILNYSKLQSAASPLYAYFLGHQFDTFVEFEGDKSISVTSLDTENSQTLRNSLKIEFWSQLSITSSKNYNDEVYKTVISNFQNFGFMALKKGTVLFE